MKYWRAPSRTARRLRAWPSKHPLLAQEMGRLVRQVDQNRPEDALGQTNGRAQTPVPGEDALKVHEGVEHIPGLRADRRLLKQNLLKTRGQDIAQVQNQEQDSDPANAWQRDVPHS